MIEDVRLAVDEETQAVVESIVRSIGYSIRDAISESVSEAIENALEDGSGVDVDSVVESLEKLRAELAGLAQAEALEGIVDHLESANDGLATREDVDTLKTTLAGDLAAFDSKFDTETDKSQAAALDAINALAGGLSEIKTCIGDQDSRLVQQDTVLDALTGQLAAGAETSEAITSKLQSMEQHARTRASSESVYGIKRQLTILRDRVDSRAGLADIESLGASLEAVEGRVPTLARSEDLEELDRKLTAIAGEMAGADGLTATKDELLERISALERLVREERDSAVDQVEQQLVNLGSRVDSRADAADVVALGASLEAVERRLPTLASGDALGDVGRKLNVAIDKMAGGAELEAARGALSERLSALETGISKELAEVTVTCLASIDPVRRSVDAVRDTLSQHDQQLQQQTKTMNEMLELIRAQQDRLAEQQTALVHLGRPWYRRILGG